MGGRSGRRPPNQRGTTSERTLTADDALRLYTNYLRWLRSDDGVRYSYLVHHKNTGGQWPGLTTSAARWGLARYTAHTTADAIAEAPPIWCDPPMVDLIAAAADTYPASDPVEEHHLPAPHGMMILARPLPSLPMIAGQPTEQQVSAITWISGMSPDGPHLTVTTMIQNFGVWRDPDLDLRVNFRGLSPFVAEWMIYGQPPRHHDSPDRSLPSRVLLTMAAICRTPLVRDDTSEVKATQRPRRSIDRPDPVVRRIHLRKPEHGRAELDAARSARAKSPVRGHWVRGHWKQQLYPSTGEHRPTWISGYPRGDFTAGTVPGGKVLVASGRTGNPATRDGTDAAAVVAQAFPAALRPGAHRPPPRSPEPGVPPVRRAHQEETERG